MAVTIDLTQSSYEEKIYPIDWTNSLLTGVTVTSVAITHVPPSGSALTITGTTTTPYSYIPVPSGLVTGVHFFHCVATTSNANLSPEVLLRIKVNY